jgi:phosphoribosylamine--glycine ligase
MRLQSDLVPIMEAVVDEKLDQCTLDIDPRATVCVVMAAGGYPKAYKKGHPISGLDKVKRMKDVVVFHAGTAAKNKQVVASGGRVLGVTALGDTVELAIKKAYQAVAKIKWTKVHYRTDIGRKALVRMSRMPKVGVVMGSDSDLPVMEAAVGIFKKFDLPFEMTVASAHRTPALAADYAGTARERGLSVVIAGAGHAAHLAGVLAAHTTLPVIGVPIDSSCLEGWDSLLSTVQMPPGIPVATMALGKPGAKNAAIFAAQILAQSDPDLAEELAKFKADMAAEVEAKAAKLSDYR